MNSRKVKRLEIYMYDFGVTTGSIQNGQRPVVVIQDDRFNASSPTAGVAPITTAVKKEHLPSHIFVGKQFGLPRPSMVLASGDTNHILSGVMNHFLSEI